MEIYYVGICLRILRRRRLSSGLFALGRFMTLLPLQEWISKGVFTMMMRGCVCRCPP